MVDKKLSTENLVDLIHVAIGDQSIEARRRAREVIFQLSLEPRQFPIDEPCEILKSSLNDTDVQVRRRAAELLGNLGVAELFDSGLRDPSWTVREAACSALARTMTQDVSESKIVLAAKVAIEDPHPLVRKAAARALKFVESSALLPGVQVFEEALACSRFTYRKRGLQNLAELKVDNESTHRRMAKLLDDSHLRVRIEASRCIGRLESSDRDFRFALASLAKRMYELDGTVGREAAKAFSVIAQRQPEWMWLQMWIPNQRFFSNLANLEKTWVYIDDTLGRLLGEAKMKAAFSITTKNRLKWAEQKLKGTKLNVVRAIAARQAICFDESDSRKFAIKETNWLISTLISAKLNIERAD